MPLHEFVCKSCGWIHEEICAADSSAPVCPKCGADSSERQIGSPPLCEQGRFPIRKLAECILSEGVPDPVPANAKQFAILL